MGFGKTGAIRALVVGIALCVAGTAMAVAPTAEQTDTRAKQKTALAPLVVHNNRGGLLRDRLRQISTLRAEGRAVHIRGAICYSTCTMLIGLPRTCVAPHTTFGFHGPSSFGRPLEPERFEYASQVIASYYPVPLRDWYMSKARHDIRGLSRIKGDQLIKLGVPACPDIS